MEKNFVKFAALLAAVFACGCLQAGTLDDIRALESGKTVAGNAPAMNNLLRPEGLPREASVPESDAPVWYRLSNGRQVDLREWKVVLFMQSTCQYCQKFDPVLKVISQQTGLSVFPISLDGRGDAAYPDVLPATPDVMVEYFQSGMPVATPTTFLTNVNTMETWPLLQGAAENAEFRARLDEVLRLTLDRQPRKNTALQGD
ncbi:conjugal transfer protein TrbB [Serratia quinivorans]|uniref:type-F conjugative transfer system pilin assembly thiol-disulfide isomerase TrbB n=1 Tax=Serratia TaxID=613 RepID=UPI001F4C5125|nr:MULTISPECIES: type-F conjugative transfer system pilin assembly thiol-disulfide isomerase TrbB [Serratia]ULG12062.1 type-F conjugative transfer system pilin assembly thiol-disulfide isomerase TrbB [Serratia entomophila]ULG12419.1 type-F conjugative transfer system pilin assembly thiol-disulfide isomerase TrbB [Serratia entomophila]ULG14997.1 type-F conjugative transfer system pilin assembly thiol-disulfide isomerase TrbB [Serratia proteamaculans]ULG15888.1 type-F conjugative transfer system 